MTNTRLSNTNIAAEHSMITPQDLREKYSRSDTATATVENARKSVEAILDGRDPRLIVVIGPCSIHDTAAAREYASRLKGLAEAVSDTMLVIMRVYFEKPRTTIGWKGFINDPRLNDSFDINHGICEARELLTWLAELGVPAGTEALDPITPQYLSDLFCWTAIGARTTESQKHRELSSGLSTAVGFKNGTDGSLEVAVNALRSAAVTHRFLGIDMQGRVAIMETRGNDYGHVILRGGREPNYDSVSVALAEQALEEAGQPLRLMIDCSHANSHKNHELQPLVAANIVDQILSGNRSIIGLMIESHLNAGSQPLSAELNYGVSITDPCIDWQTTEETLTGMHQKLQPVIADRHRSG